MSSVLRASRTAASQLTLAALGSFSVPKVDALDADNQDRFAIDLSKGRVALADGVTNSYRQGVWADVLVKSLVRDGLPSPAQLGSRLDDCRAIWSESAEKAPPEQWFQRATDRHADATMLGFELSPNGSWSTFAVGDSCLFHLRPSATSRAVTLVTSLPLNKSQEFSRETATASSAAGTVPVPVMGNGRAEVGDLFVLATDALAKHFFEKQEAHMLVRFVEELRAIDDASTYAESVMRWRAEGLGDDDTTLIMVEVAEAIHGLPAAVSRAQSAHFQRGGLLPRQQRPSRRGYLALLLAILVALLLGIGLGRFVWKRGSNSDPESIAAESTLSQDDGVGASSRSEKARAIENHVGCATAVCEPTVCPPTVCQRTVCPPAACPLPARPPSVHHGGEPSPQVKFVHLKDQLADLKGELDEAKSKALAGKKALDAVQRELKNVRAPARKAQLALELNSRTRDYELAKARRDSVNQTYSTLMDALRGTTQVVSSSPKLIEKK